MLFFLISCLSFVLLSKSLPLVPFSSWAIEMRLLPVWLWKSLLTKRRRIMDGLFGIQFSAVMAVGRSSLSPKVESVEEREEMSLLDMPELALECILGKLPPSALCNMAGVCRSLRERCRSDHLWERHMKEKWGRVIGHAADQVRESQIIASRKHDLLDQSKQKGLVPYLSRVWPFSWVKTKLYGCTKPRSSLPADSKISWYLSLEAGKFWFPAQVYNRENGHVGFMLSCYDAELCYNSQRETFHSRYPPHGRRTIVLEEDVQWDRIRAPPVDTLPHDLHVSDCLNDLRPGDHIEIQWRKNKEFPYGWWYGVVGHLETCDEVECRCFCHDSDTVALEFNQYSMGSRWRRTIINRKDHREDGNEADGFYGGIRKLYNAEEIAVWKELWPTQTLE
ncbi:hypothetical protein Syun_001929 [Stephania yunnanensis]|uniref:F-box domain-containing protein n=1 Tax=Stephania yunnanensis TaxID=152371 RepID=A0AAP0LKI8_9MAGN